MCVHQFKVISQPVANKALGTDARPLTSFAASGAGQLKRYIAKE